MVQVETNKYQPKKENLETLPVIGEFQDLFSEEIPGLLPCRDTFIH